MAQAALFTRRGFLTGKGEHLLRRRGPDPSAETNIRTMLVVSDACLARIGVTCMTCRDVCLEGAIRFRPRLGGPFLPEVVDDLCSRCGDCFDACPAGALRLETAAAGKADG